jgi:hypothetical protein
MSARIRTFLVVVRNLGRNHAQSLFDVLSHPIFHISGQREVNNRWTSVANYDLKRIESEEEPDNWFLHGHMHSVPTDLAFVLSLGFPFVDNGVDAREPCSGSGSLTLGFAVGSGSLSMPQGCGSALLTAIARYACKAVHRPALAL